MTSGVENQLHQFLGLIRRSSSSRPFVSSKHLSLLSRERKRAVSLGWRKTADSIRGSTYFCVYIDIHNYINYIISYIIHTVHIWLCIDFLEGTYSIVKYLRASRWFTHRATVSWWIHGEHRPRMICATRSSRLPISWSSIWTSYASRQLWIHKKSETLE